MPLVVGVILIGYARQRMNALLISHFRAFKCRIISGMTSFYTRPTFALITDIYSTHLFHWVRFHY